VVYNESLKQGKIMSRMSELHLLIMDLYGEGLTAKQIAEDLDIPLYIVISVFEDMNRDE
jgi:hypothetical protein